MSDWLGRAARPRGPRPELKAQVLARARARRGRRGRWSVRLAAAAGLLLVAGGGAWSYRTVIALQAERDRLLADLQGARDSLGYVVGTTSRVIQIPVSTNGRVGAVTIFADSTKHRWLVRCEGLAPNQPDQSYQLWFITDMGMKSSASSSTNGCAAVSGPHTSRSRSMGRQVSGTADDRGRGGQRRHRFRAGQH